MEVCVGVHYLPCFAMWCTTLHNTLPGYTSLALHLCTMYAQCISNPKSIGNDEMFCVTISWCVRCLTCVLCLMDAMVCLFAQLFEADKFLLHDYCSLCCLWGMSDIGHDKRKAGAHGTCSLHVGDAHV